MNEEFHKRQEEAKNRINRIDRETLPGNPKRDQFFEAVYDQAAGDAAMVPWADLAPKPQLLEWLAANAGNGRKAMDVGCGLGDNAEALASSGYKTTAFDYSQKAIDWATQRFAASAVEYQVADLFDLPAHWRGAFDLVHECYTLQSIPPETLIDTIPAIASLVAPGGRLLVYTRTRKKGAGVEGPPWPLEEDLALSFGDHGLFLHNNHIFNNERQDRSIPHFFSEWRRPL